MTSKKKTEPKKSKKSEDKETVTKKIVTAYKYSSRGSGSLFEAIILQGEPYFVTWYPDYGIDNKNIDIKPYIEETTIIIKPPSPEEYPYTPYEFADQEELNDYFRRANTISSKNDLYQKAKSFFKKYVDQDKNIIVILSADSIFTYFQDLFPITHYTEGIGGNDVGKSSLGFTFTYTGYRVVRGTSISGANYYRILGNVEAGQCTIIEDEADNISNDDDKIKILKAGYELDSRIPKTNMNAKNQEMNWFFPYCYKMILAEKSLSEWKAKGLVDRTFTFKCRPGRVRHSIKKVVSQTINKSPELQKLYDELLDFRKLMLCYRLIHYSEELPDIEIKPLINRDLELCHPLLQLFYGTDAFEEIRSALEIFVKQRRERRSRSTQAALYPILKKFVLETSQTDSNIVNITYSSIWEDITDYNSPIKGSFNPVNNQEYITTFYGSLYQNTLSRFISDNFKADLKPSKHGSVLTFDKEEFRTFDEIYNHKVEGEEENAKIEVSLVAKTVTDGGDGGDVRVIEMGEEIDFSSKTDDNNNNKKSNDDDESDIPQPSPSSLSNNNKNIITDTPLEPSLPPQPSPFPPNCYYCEFKQHETKAEYDSHVVMRHSGKPGYPGPADLKALNLKPQGMSWEV